MWEENLKATPALKGNSFLATNAIASAVKGKRKDFLTDQLIGYVSQLSQYLTFIVPQAKSLVSSHLFSSSAILPYFFSYEILIFHNTVVG